MILLPFLTLVALCEGSQFWARRRINCGVSAWSDWSSPANGGLQTRSRTILRHPRNGGTACPSLVETRDNSRDSSSPWGRYDSRVLGVDGHRSTVLSRGGEDGLTLLPRDLLLIIDMSGSINGSQWSMLKSKIADLVEGICGGIGSGRQNNRIAAITFSSRIVLNFNFKTYFSFASLRRAILRMPQVRGNTCTGDAFSYANEHLFKPSAGMRSSAESVKEVLVITDGRSNCGADVIQNVRMLQVKAFVFVLAVGNYGDRGRLEIESLVSRPLTNHIFSIANFLQFKEMVEIILDIPENCAPFELS